VVTAPGKFDFLVLAITSCGGAGSRRVGLIRLFQCLFGGDGDECLNAWVQAAHAIPGTSVAAPATRSARGAADRPLTPHAFKSSACRLLVRFVPAQKPLWQTALVAQPLDIVRQHDHGQKSAWLASVVASLLGDASVSLRFKTPPQGSGGN